jgi:hypothetical protein
MLGNSSATPVAFGGGNHVVSQPGASQLELSSVINYGGMGGEQTSMIQAQMSISPRVPQNV